MSTLKQIFTYLKQTFPNPKTELVYNNDFQLIIAVILSAQTTDKQVNKVTNKIFKNIKNPYDIITFWEEKLIKSISSINYYKNKWKNIFKLSEYLINKDILYKIWIKDLSTYKEKNQIYFIPKEIEDLKKLPGIWEKTAKVIAHVLFNQPVIAVDTHVHRVCNRWWITQTVKPEETSKELENIIPNKYKKIAHHSIILFWRYICTARNPKCISCKLKKICKRYQNNYNSTQ